MTAPIIRRMPGTGGGGRGRLVGGAAAVAAASVQQYPEEAYPPTKPYRGVQWPLAYLAFLLYIYVITSFRIPLGTFAMTVAIIAVPLQHLALRTPPQLAWMGFYMLWASLGMITTDHPDLVWDAVTDFGKIWLIIFVMANVLRTRAQLRFYLIFFIGCFALYPVRGALFNYFIYHGTLFGRVAWNYIYANPNDLAAFCLLQLSITCGLLVTEPKGWVRKAAYLGVYMLTLVMLLTQSRGGIIALVVFALFTVKLRKIRIRLSRVVLAGVLGGIVLALVANTGVWDRLSGLKHVTDTEELKEVDKEGSAEQRFEIWKVATSIIAENPLSGVGLGAYKVVHAQHAMRPEFNPTARGERDTHDTYLNVFAETGIVGLFLFVGLLSTTLVAAERTRRRYRAVLPRSASQLFYLEVGLGAYLVACIWGTYPHLVFTYLHIGLIGIATQMLREEAEEVLAGDSRGGQRIVDGVSTSPGVGGRAGPRRRFTQNGRGLGERGGAGPLRVG